MNVARDSVSKEIVFSYYAGTLQFYVKRTILYDLQGLKSGTYTLHR